MVEKVEDYPYSSSKAHILGLRDEILGEELFDEQQRKDYREFIRAGISEKEMQSIRYSTRTGRPFGSEPFVRKLEKKFDRKFLLLSPGRPKKKGNK